MTAPTETYTAVTTTECLPKKPVKTSLFLRFRANVLAMFQGASGAPRLWLGAIERVTAGDTQRALNADQFDETGDVYVAAWSFGIMQGGTLQMSWQSLADGAGECETGIRVTRAGTATEYGENTTSSTSWGDETVDITVEPGDLVAFIIRENNAVGTASIRNMTVSTSGASIFPCAGMFGYIDANEALT